MRPGGPDLTCPIPVAHGRDRPFPDAQHQPSHPAMRSSGARAAAMAVTSPAGSVR